MRVKADTLIQHAKFNPKNPFIRLDGVYDKMDHRYVCPKCYGLTLTDTRKSDPIRKYQTCVICGWHGPKEQTLTLKEYIEKETVQKDGVLYLR